MYCVRRRLTCSYVIQMCAAGQVQAFPVSPTYPSYPFPVVLDMPRDRTCSRRFNLDITAGCIDNGTRRRTSGGSVDCMKSGSFNPSAIDPHPTRHNLAFINSSSGGRGNEPHRGTGLHIIISNPRISHHGSHIRALRLVPVELSASLARAQSATGSREHGIAIVEVCGRLGHFL